MRTYQAHVADLLSPQTQSRIAKRPTLRSSALFPLLLEPGVQARVLFLGYWQVKRAIQTLTLVTTLRNKKGEVVLRNINTVKESRAYSVDCEALLRSIGIHSLHFQGSLELEFFSLEDLVFPFPAAVINYYGDGFSSVVHTAQRVYNDYEDYAANVDSQAQESGFTIYASDTQEPFIAIVNGPQSITGPPVTLTLYNGDGQQLVLQTEIFSLDPYETASFYPARETDLATFLGNRPGTCKVRLQTGWCFSRLLVGNRQKSSPGLSITHTYYDCSNSHKESDYWPPAEDGWVDAALMVPVHYSEQEFTRVYFYPIYSPSELAIDVAFYSHEGGLQAYIPDALIVRSEAEILQQLDLGTLAAKHTEKPYTNSTARVIARPIGPHALPTRLKIGLDIGHSDLGMPCNICTNLQPWNARWDSKPGSFRWAPLLADQPGASLWITNSAPKKNYTQAAVGTLTFYRSNDTETLQRPLQLPPHGSCVINTDHDRELHAFFDDQPGWCTVQADNPYVNSFYFSRNRSGFVGGDHGF